MTVTDANSRFHRCEDTGPAASMVSQQTRCRSDGADSSARSERERVVRHSPSPANRKERPMPAPPVIEVDDLAHHLSKGPE